MHGYFPFRHLAISREESVCSGALEAIAPYSAKNSFEWVVIRVGYC